jgi:transposase InsO family protein
MAQLAFPLPIPFAAAQPERRTLPDISAHPEAQQRYQLLRMLFDYQDDPSRFGALLLNDGHPVTSFTRMVAYAAQTSNPPVREATIYRWLRRYKEDGLNGLEDKARSDKSKSRWFEKYPQAKLIVADEVLSNSSKTVAWESLVRQAPRLGIPANDLPSYETVRAWIDLDEIPKPVKILAREGERALNEKALPFLLRKYVDVPVNDTWTSDHAISDMIVRNDIFAGIPANQQMRLRFTCILDWRTRAVVGKCWTPEGSSRSIATAFRDAVYRFGPPRVFLADNGKDFKRFAKGASFAWQRVANPQLVSDIRWFDQLGVLARLGVLIQHCMKYAPQGKHIERFFRTMHMQLEAIFAHYTTGSPFTRPDATNAAMAEHGRLMRHGHGDESPLMLASEYIRIAATWIEEYNRAAHSGKGNDGRAPLDIFDEELPVAARRIPDASAMDHLFWECVERKVDACTVRYENWRYEGADPASVQALFFANGGKVLFHFDPNQPEHGVITDVNRKVIARVQAETLAPHSREASPMIAAKIRERRGLRNKTALAIRTVHRQAAELGHVSAFDALRQRAQATVVPGELINQPSRRIELTPAEPQNSLAPGELTDKLTEILRRNRANQ